VTDQRAEGKRRHENRVTGRARSERRGLGLAKAVRTSTKLPDHSGSDEDGTRRNG
jgi:hypothetical protein